jgi:hypothetical protein
VQRIDRQPVVGRIEDGRGDQHGSDDRHRNGEQRPLADRGFQQPDHQSEHGRRRDVGERGHQHHGHAHREDRMAGQRTEAPEARRRAQDVDQAVEPFAGRHGPLPGVATESIDLGDLVQPQGLRRPLGQRHALGCLVVQRDEERGRQHDHARLPHAVGERHAAQQKFDLRRLLSAREVRLAEPEHEFQHQGRVVPWCGFRHADRRAPGVTVPRFPTATAGTPPAAAPAGRWRPWRRRTRTRCRRCRGGPTCTSS